MITVAANISDHWFIISINQSQIIHNILDVKILIPLFILPEMQIKGDFFNLFFIYKIVSILKKNYYYHII